MNGRTDSLLDLELSQTLDKLRAKSSPVLKDLDLTK